MLNLVELRDKCRGFFIFTGCPSVSKGVTDSNNLFNLVDVCVATVLRHGRDVHPTWVKSFIETLSNTKRDFLGS